MHGRSIQCVNGDILDQTQVWPCSSFKNPDEKLGYDR